MSRLFPDCLVFDPDRLVPMSWKHSTAGRFDKYAWNIFAGRPISNNHRLFHPIRETSDFNPIWRDSTRFQDITIDQMTTILLKVMLLIQRTLFFSVPLSNAGHTAQANSDGAIKSIAPRSCKIK